MYAKCANACVCRVNARATDPVRPKFSAIRVKDRRCLLDKAVDEIRLDGSVNEDKGGEEVMEGEGYRRRRKRNMIESLLHFFRCR